MVAVPICPIWFFLALFFAFVYRASWEVTTSRILMPLATFVLVVVNARVQQSIGAANAARVIEACEEYNEANGNFPERLDDLVPLYLSSVPRAKYCVWGNEFEYWGPPDLKLVWVPHPTVGYWTYHFDRGEWRHW